jgi:hypothetical protein
VKNIILLLITVISINSFSEEVKYKEIEKISLELESNGETKTSDYNIKAPKHNIDTSKEKGDFDYYKNKGEEAPPFDTLSFGGKIGLLFLSWLVEPESHKKIEDKNNSKLEEKLDATK